MEQNEYQIISIILAIRVANQLPMRIRCLLSETLTSCHCYQYNRRKCKLLHTTLFLHAATFRVPGLQ